jgi:hypothetical protein
MYILDKVKAEEILTKELGYKDYAVKGLLKDYPQIHDELSHAVEKWLEDRTIEDVDVFGLSVKELMNINDNETFLHAIKMLNALYNMNEEERTNFIRILRKPHTFE